MGSCDFDVVCCSFYLIKTLKLHCIRLTNLKQVCVTLSGYSIVGGPLFIQAAQWHMKPKMVDFPALKIAGSVAFLLLCFGIVQPIEQAHYRLLFYGVQLG